MKIAEDILKLFENSSLNFKLRSESSDLWHESFSLLEYRFVDYLLQTLITKLSIKNKIMMKLLIFHQ